MPETTNEEEVKQPTIQELLAAPIEFQWRVKTFYKQGVEKKELKAGSLPAGTKGQFLAYIDARDVYDRLDAVLGIGNWQDVWEPIPGTPAVKVTILANIDGERVSKEDVGYPNSDRDEEPLKSAVSDGIKRAAVHFGIGRFLYSMEAIWVEVDKWGKPLRPITSGSSSERDSDQGDTGSSPASTPTAPKREFDELPESHTGPSCPVCGGAMWDNRENKKNPKAPDFKCKDGACDGVIWPPKDYMASQTAPQVVEEMDADLASMFGDK